MNMSLGVPLNWYGCFGKETNLLLLGIKPYFLGCAAYSLDTD